MQSRVRAPLDWATTQNDLATALTILGETGSGTQSLQQAIQACRAALEVWTQESDPLDWAGAHINLANALRLIAQKERRPPCEAVGAHQKALVVFVRAGQYQTELATKVLRKDLAADPHPSPHNCPMIPTETWKQVSRAIATQFSSQE